MPICHLFFQDVLAASFIETTVNGKDLSGPRPLDLHGRLVQLHQRLYQSGSGSPVDCGPVPHEPDLPFKPT
jgi:hypothetical protein